MTITLPSRIEPIIQALIVHRIRPVLVGGYLRNALWGEIPGTDIDLELYDLDSIQTLLELLKPFGKAVLVGKSFGVVKLSYGGYDIDLAQPRTETKIALGHRGFEVRTYTDLDFKTAASRRDFTINAIGYDLHTSTLLDPFDGIDDLKRRRLDCVLPESFVEDPLRLLRVVQFAARFHLTCSERLLHLCQQMYHQGMLDQLPKERLFQELQKLLLSPKPSIGLGLLKTMDALDIVPGLKALQPKEWAFTCQKLDRLAVETERTLTVMLAALVLYFDEKQISRVLDILTQEKKIHMEVKLLVQAYQELCQGLHVTPYAVRALACRLPINMLILLGIGENDERCAEYLRHLQQNAVTLKVYDKAPVPLLKGRDLLARGINPSVRYKEILSQAFEAQLHGAFETRKEALKWLDVTLSG